MYPKLNVFFYTLFYCVLYRNQKVTDSTETAVKETLVVLCSLINQSYNIPHKAIVVWLDVEGIATGTETIGICESSCNLLEPSGLA